MSCQVERERAGARSRSILLQLGRCVGVGVVAAFVGVDVVVDVVAVGVVCVVARTGVEVEVFVVEAALPACLRAVVRCRKLPTLPDLVQFRRSARRSCLPECPLSYCRVY